VTFNKTTYYALYAALEMARAGDTPVPVNRVAERYGVPESALAKVFQQMVRAGLAAGTRGIGGGYRLSTAPSKLTVLDVIAAFEPQGHLAPALPAPRDRGDEPIGAPDAGLRRLFEEVDELVRSTYASVSLETLVKRGATRRSAPGAPR
jgi:Rrf2 family protein